MNTDQRRSRQVPTITRMYRGVRRNVCFHNNIILYGRWVPYITCELTFSHLFPICLHVFWSFRRMESRDPTATWNHVIKMQSHVWHTNMVSLNRFWNMLYLTFHGSNRIDSLESHSKFSRVSRPALIRPPIRTREPQPIGSRTRILKYTGIQWNNLF